MLEPYEWKRSRTVLRREGASNRPDLVDYSPLVRRLGGQVAKIIEDDGGAVCIRGDWRQREKVLRPDLFEMQARRNGLTRVEVSKALESGFEGRVVGC